jgi:hypothetical protein
MVIIKSKNNNMDDLSFTVPLTYEKRTPLAALISRRSRKQRVLLAKLPYLA